MVLRRENVHPRALSFRHEVRVAKLRDVDGLSWSSIAGKVWNLAGERPDWKTCSRVYEKLQKRTKPKADAYKNCGRHKKINEDDEKWLVQKMLQLRKEGPCTSQMLQRLLAKHKKVTVEASLVRRVLKRNGYKWLRKVQKPKFSKELKAERKHWADEVLTMTDAQLRAKLNFAMDGVVFTVPPKGLTARENHCRAEETHCWRKPSEGMKEECLGKNAYKKQGKPGTIVPLWGGLSADGFAVALWHEARNVTAEEWAEAVEACNLKEALETVNPGRRGPWTLLTDNESFLRAPASQAAHRKARVRLWKIPPTSPDLNPVEKFWAWVRKQLVRMDLRDLRAGKAAVNKSGLKLRLQRLVKTQKAKTVAGKIAGGLKKVCTEVSKRGGGPAKS